MGPFSGSILIFGSVGGGWAIHLTLLKNISQNGNLPQIPVEINNIWNHHLVNHDNVPFFYLYWLITKKRPTPPIQNSTKKPKKTTKVTHLQI